MNIELLTLSKVTSISGDSGDFTVTLKQSPRFVDMEKCIACGTCAEKRKGFSDNKGDMKPARLPR